jgi:hypothetical protein
MFDTFAGPFLNRIIVNKFGLKSTDRVFVVPCMRGNWVLPIANHLTSGMGTLVSYLTCIGKVIVREPWNTQTMRISPEWVTANARRAGIPDERLDIGEGDPRQLDFKDETFDVVFATAISYMYPTDVSNPKDIRSLTIIDVATYRKRVVQSFEAWRQNGTISYVNSVTLVDIC